MPLDITVDGVAMEYVEQGLVGHAPCEAVPLASFQHKKGAEEEPAAHAGEAVQHRVKVKGSTVHCAGL